MSSRSRSGLALAFARRLGIVRRALTWCVVIILILATACVPTLPGGAWTPPKPARGSLPSRLIIPAIGVDARVTPSGLDPAGDVVVPGAADEVAWYEFAGRPGEVDNAVLAAHNIWRGTAGAFAKLPALRPGDEVYVLTVNGGRFAYIVSTVATYEGPSSPLANVFGPTREPILTLITCAGLPDSDGDFPQRIVVRAVGRT
ncbi:MAG: class F sortase [Chloroflexota bacterium]|nr:MAG: class F sortase [Chloroflexota bacterium]